MPAYSTNMRLKFPIVALVLEVITIILFGVFTVYDDGKSQGHDAHSNETHHDDNPMHLYPSKSTWAACCMPCCCMCLVVGLLLKSLKFMDHFLLEHQLLLHNAFIAVKEKKGLKSSNIQHYQALQLLMVLRGNFWVAKMTCDFN